LRTMSNRAVALAALACTVVAQDQRTHNQRRR
jgi:hypothetical protein